MGRIARSKQERLDAAVNKLLTTFLIMRLRDEPEGGRLPADALREQRAAPDAPLDERPALDAFWNWLKDGEKAWAVYMGA